VCFCPHPFQLVRQQADIPVDLPHVAVQIHPDILLLQQRPKRCPFPGLPGKRRIPQSI
jgi:hypothetical protein